MAEIDAPFDTAPFVAVMAEAWRRNLSATEMMRLEALKWEFIARAPPERYDQFPQYAAAILLRNSSERLTVAPPGSASPAADTPRPVPRDDLTVLQVGWISRGRNLLAANARLAQIALASLILVATALYTLVDRMRHHPAQPPSALTVSIAKLKIVLTQQIDVALQVAAKKLRWTLQPDTVWWSSAAMIMLSAVGYGVWRNFRRQQLRRDANENSQPLAKVAVQFGRNALFTNHALRGALRDLRRHRGVPGQRIDVPASIRATLANGGVPIVRFGKTQLTPEYLIFAEREAPADHLPEVATALGDRLDQASIINTRFEYFSDPTELRRVSGKEEAQAFEPLEAVAGRFAGATTMLLMESTDALAGGNCGPGAKRGGNVMRAAPQWLERLLDASDAYLLNPRARRQWSGEERALETCGLDSFEASASGLAQLAERIGRGEAPDLAEAKGGSAPDLVAYLARHRTMLLSPVAPDPERVLAVVDNLELWLDAGAMDWLRTIALFPIITTGFTFFAGATLLERNLVTHERFLEIARLPWLRTGQMPNWLRQALVNGFSPARLDRATHVIHAYLMPPSGPAGERTDFLRLRKQAAEPGLRAKLMARLAAMDNPLSEDTLMLGALNGQPPERLAIAVDEAMLPQVPWHRRAWVRALVGAMAGLIMVSLARPPLFTTRVPDPASAVLPPRSTPTTGPANLPDTSQGPVQVTRKVMQDTRVPAPPSTSAAANKTAELPSLYIQIPLADEKNAAEALARQLSGLMIAGKPLSMHPIQVVANAPSDTQLRCFQPDTCANAPTLSLALAQVGVNARIVPFRANDFQWRSAKKPSQYELWIGTSVPIQGATVAPDVANPNTIPVDTKWVAPVGSPTSGKFYVTCSGPRGGLGVGSAANLKALASYLIVRNNRSSTALLITITRVPKVLQTFDESCATDIDVIFFKLEYLPNTKIQHEVDDTVDDTTKIGVRWDIVTPQVKK